MLAKQTSHLVVGDQNLTVLAGPALYGAHIDDLVGTLPEEDVLWRYHRRAPPNH